MAIAGIPAISAFCQLKTDTSAQEQNIIVQRRLAF